MKLHTKRIGEIEIRKYGLPVVTYFPSPCQGSFRLCNRTHLHNVTAPLRGAQQLKLTISSTSHSILHANLRNVKNLKPPPNILSCFKCPFGFFINYFKLIQISLPFFFLSLPLFTADLAQITITLNSHQSPTKRKKKVVKERENKWKPY